jgi:hypothetical protein
MSNIKKVEKVYNEVVNRFDKLGGFELFYDYDSEKLKPIVVANGEKEVKALMEKKIKNHPEKYKNATLVRVKILRYPNGIGKTKKEMLTAGGAFGIMVMVYKVDNKLELTRANEHRQQSFWYSDDELLNRGFSSKDIKLIIKAVYNNLVDMSPFAIYNISEIDKLFKKKKN